MSYRATSLTENSGIAISREIDSKYDAVKTVADNIDIIESVSEINGDDLSIVADIDLPSLYQARDEAVNSSVSAGDYEELARQHKEAASGSADAASTDAGLSNTWSIDSRDYSTEALGYRNTASDMAGFAQADRLLTDQAVIDTSGYSISASNFATASSNSAVDASGFSSTASGAATTATNKASDASGFAFDAEQSAIASDASAQAAAISAGSVVTPTPESILADLLTVDGPNSLLNADNLDGYTWDTVTNFHISTNRSVEAGRGSGSVAMTANDSKGNANLAFNHKNGVPDFSGNSARITVNTDVTTNPAMKFQLLDNTAQGVNVTLPTVFEITGSEARVLGNKVWNSGNDGAASGLDADLLDGLHANAFALNTSISNIDNTSDTDKPISTATQLVLDTKLNLGGGNLTGPVTTSSTIEGRNIATDGIKLDGIESGATADQTANEILTSIKTIDGPSSGLNADLLDGLEANDFATAAQGVKADSALPATDFDPTVDTLADAIAMTLVAGRRVSTKGYFSVGDGGGATYNVVLATEFSGTPDGYSDHVSASGNVLQLIVRNGELNAKQLGVKGDGLPDNSAIIALEERVLATKTSVFFPVGVYVMSNTNFPFRQQTVPPTKLKNYFGITIRGAGKGLTIFKTESVTGADVLQLNGIRNLCIKDLSVTAIISSTTGAGSNGVSITNGCYNIDVDVDVYDLPHTVKTDYIDGGKAFTIQTGNFSSLQNSLIRLRGTVNNCAYGFGIDTLYEKFNNYTTDNIDSVSCDFVIRDCWKGIALSAAGATAPLANVNKHSGLVIKASLENCTQSIVAVRWVRANIDAVVKVVKAYSDLNRPFPPDQSVYGVKVLGDYRSDIKVKGRVHTCDSKLIMGGILNSAGVHASSVGTRLYMELDSTTTNNAEVVIINAGGNTVLEQDVTLVGITDGTDALL